jgi:hypothetical protein
MKIIINERQYNDITYKRRYAQIKKLIDGLSSNPDMYYDEDEFYNDIKDLVYKNVFLGDREGLHWNEIDRDYLMSFIDVYFQEYIKNIYRDNQ